MVAVAVGVGMSSFAQVVAGSAIFDQDAAKHGNRPSVGYHCDDCDVVLYGAVPTSAPLRCPCCGALLPQLPSDLLTAALLGETRGEG